MPVVLHYSTFEEITDDIDGARVWGIRFRFDQRAGAMRDPHRELDGETRPGAFAHPSAVRSRRRVYLRLKVNPTKRACVRARSNGAALFAADGAVSSDSPGLGVS